MSHATPRWGKIIYRVPVPEKPRAQGNKVSFCFVSAGFRDMREKYRYLLDVESSRARSNHALGDRHVTMFFPGSSISFSIENPPVPPVAYTANRCIFLFQNSPGDLKWLFNKAACRQGKRYDINERLLPRQFTPQLRVFRRESLDKLPPSHLSGWAITCRIPVFKILNGTPTR